MKQKEEMIDVEIDLGKELYAKIHKMTKKELINEFIVSAMRDRVQEDTIKKLTVETQCIQAKAQLENSKANAKIETLNTNIDKAEAYVEQGRAMINAVMERWYEYDT